MKIRENYFLFCFSSCFFRIFKNYSSVFRSVFFLILHQGRLSQSICMYYLQSVYSIYILFSFSLFGNVFFFFLYECFFSHLARLGKCGLRNYLWSRLLLFTQNHSLYNYPVWSFPISPIIKTRTKVRVLQRTFLQIET